MDTIINYKPRELYNEKLHALLLERAKNVQFRGGFHVTVDDVEYGITESEREEIVSQSMGTDERDPLSLAGSIYTHKATCRIWTVRKSQRQAIKEDNISDYSAFLDMLDGQQMRQWMAYKAIHGKSVSTRRAFLLSKS